MVQVLLRTHGLPTFHAVIPRVPQVTSCHGFKRVQKARHHIQTENIQQESRHISSLYAFLRVRKLFPTSGFISLHLF